MTLICLPSPKGGVGKTTLTANLAYTLQRQGMNVTAMDLDSQDALKLHFGVSINDEYGYVPEALNTPYWQELTTKTACGVELLPYGRTRPVQRERFETSLRQDPDWLRRSLTPFYESPSDVLLVDLPPGYSVALEAVCRLQPLCLTVLLADSASLAVLPAIESGEFYGDLLVSSRQVLYVVNQLDLRNELSHSVFSLLKKRLGAAVVGSVHRDAHVAEAHASQQSVIEYAYTSAVVNDLEDIAHNLMRLMPDINLFQSQQRAGASAE